MLLSDFELVMLSRLTLIQLETIACEEGKASLPLTVALIKCNQAWWFDICIYLSLSAGIIQSQVGGQQEMVTLEGCSSINPEKLLPLSVSKFTVHLTQNLHMSSLSGKQELSVCFVHGEILGYR